jgi:hypothetical protein
MEITRDCPLSDGNFHGLVEACGTAVSILMKLADGLEMRHDL